MGEVLQKVRKYLQGADGCSSESHDMERRQLDEVLDILLKVWGGVGEQMEHRLQNSKEGKEKS